MATAEPTIDIDKYTAGDIPGGTQQVICKLMVSNAAAGSIIGKSGASIDQIQRSSGARVQLSRSGEFYPGTTDRVLLVSGCLHHVLTAVFLTLEKSDDGRSSAGRKETLRLAVNRKLCGAVIGASGATVREFMADSGAVIRVQPMAELSPSDGERLISVAGSRDQVLRAVALLLNTLAADDKYGAYMELTMQLAASQGLVASSRSGGAKSALAGLRTVTTLYIPDDDVGAILGRRGAALADIQASSKAAVRISDRKAMDPGSQEREVTISGTYAAVELACSVMAEKLAANHRLREDGRERHDDHRPSHEQDAP